jgi:RNA polymerase sigma factor (TIGR02999 family)
MVDLTRILQEAQEGHAGAAEEFAALLYAELREIARREMAAERADHTLQPTALVHEAYLRLIGGESGSFEDREHFFAAAATAIRRVLVDHARNRAREKRGGGFERVSLDEVDPAAPIPPEGLLALDDALARLAGFDPLKARIVELRFFAGLKVEELARVLGASESTVRREWRMARAWLHGELDGSDGT